ncbi:hypothetical protein F4818DRAFT_135179 [Hypoxylon cercidicola]|nr:hypothetical protein F4818DRAFT_135179 [Hypoxylon cercidicola]
MKTLEDFIRPDFAGKDYDPEKEPIIREQINTYVAESFQFWEDDDKYCDEWLWDAFKKDYRNWTIKHFEAMYRTLRKMVCRRLYLHGLYAECRTNADYLMKILNATECPLFPPEAAREESLKSPDTFISMSNPHFHRKRRESLQEWARKNRVPINTLPKWAR